MGLVLKISKEGYDVKTADDKDLVFSSELNTLKVAHQDEPESSGTYNHGLGYSPAFFVTYGNNFLGQNQTSPFEVTFYSDGTSFYYAGACKYYLFYQEV
jgi:hypothetical protein